MLKMKGMRFPKEIILLCIRWYAAYPLSYRNMEEMMQERGVYVDHSSVSRWAVKFLPMLEKIFRKHKRPVGVSWRMDETYIKVNGQWKYLYRAVDKEGSTIDFLLRAKRDTVAARRFFEKAMRQNGDPEKVTMDKSGANKAAMDAINKDRDVPIEVRQVKYLNNIVEQDHRFVKRVTRPMLGFKTFRTARAVLAGIELMHMIRKEQLSAEKGKDLSFAEQFYALAA
ncbi:MAG: integrase catalytic region [Comamonadaceae bacterium]|nr:MAG: integrase catalytic region [Comamonadaceae bacterium]